MSEEMDLMLRLRASLVAARKERAQRSAVEVIAQALHAVDCDVNTPFDPCTWKEGHYAGANAAAEALLSAGSVQYGVRMVNGLVYEFDDLQAAQRSKAFYDDASVVQRRSGLPVDEEWKDSQ